MPYDGDRTAGFIATGAKSSLLERQGAIILVTNKTLNYSIQLNTLGLRNRFVGREKESMGF